VVLVELEMERAMPTTWLHLMPPLIQVQEEVLLGTLHQEKVEVVLWL